MKISLYVGRCSPTIVAAAILIFCAIGLSAQQSRPQNEFVIRNVRIFDGTRVIPSGDVWVRNGVIHAVGKHLNAPASVRSIDGSGDTLLPGLINAHAHIFGAALTQSLAFGVTTDLDMFTDHKYAAQIRKAQAEGKDLDMADLRSAGTLVTAPGGHGTEYGMPIPTITSPAGAQAFVDARIAEGSDYIKIMYDDGKTYSLHFPTISKETMAAVIAAAHRRGKLAVVHIGSMQGAKDAIAAGADGLAHLFVDAPPDAEFISLVVKHHAFVVPTASVLASITGDHAGEKLVSDPELGPYLPPDAVRNLNASFPGKHGQFRYVQETIRQLSARHVPILAGTDAPNPGTTYGASMHGEMSLLVEAGLTPTQALASATSVPAHAFHLLDRGQIAVGRRADLLLVKGDPTTDISATCNIVGIWKLGVAFDRNAYRAAVENAKRTAEQRAAALAAVSSDGLISGFDAGDKAESKFGAGWVVSTDSMRGGQSTAQMKVVSGGAESSRGALEIEGTVVQSAAAWAGAMFFPGPTPMAPTNLSSKKTITFWVRGDGKSYEVLLFTQSNGFMPRAQSFQTGPEWQKVSIPFSSFQSDGHDVAGIFFGASSQPGQFRLIIDNVRLE